MILEDHVQLSRENRAGLALGIVVNSSKDSASPGFHKGRDYRADNLHHAFPLGCYSAVEDYVTLGPAQTAEDCKVPEPAEMLVDDIDGGNPQGLDYRTALDYIEHAKGCARYRSYPRIAHRPHSQNLVSSSLGYPALSDRVAASRTSSKVVKRQNRDRSVCWDLVHWRNKTC